jgi:hypothetical protein
MHDRRQRQMCIRDSLHAAGCCGHLLGAATLVVSRAEKARSKLMAQSAAKISLS